jgi:hypothetical protein
MPFTEKTKLKVRKKAAFQCCRCKGIGVEIHHIVPESDGGDDSINNAAPLCAKCHADFGDNIKKRKEIRQMRDWWYEKASEQINKNRQFSQWEKIIKQYEIKDIAPGMPIRGKKVIIDSQETIQWACPQCWNGHIEQLLHCKYHTEKAGCYLCPNCGTTIDWNNNKMSRDELIKLFVPKIFEIPQ